MINTRLVYISIVISGILLLLVTIFPNIDIDFSNLFYNEQESFFSRDNIIVQFCFIIIPILTKTLIVVLLLYLLYLVIRYRSLKKILLSGSIYLVISTAIGPGLLVNHIFKENFGRARPIQITNFSGTQKFSKFFEITNECKHNCSFSSGHAAMAYSFSNLAYVAPYVFFTRIYSLALFFGSAVGMSRILMGGHFLSDVLASCFVVLIINHLLYLCCQKLKSV
ncbi:MAG: phosphatase PAP2 family protein [Rickettsia endosymbiont of Bryobia graminum]|nr:phosphatase PAP2 family protein [Rickettsia endosymbiont of Bryobia graminum]